MAAAQPALRTLLLLLLLITAAAGGRNPNLKYLGAYNAESASDLHGVAGCESHDPRTPASSSIPRALPQIRPPRPPR